MNCPSRRTARLVGWVVALALPTVAFADQLIVGGVNYTDAKIVNLDQGRLQFRSADGRLHAAWLDEVELMIIDRAGVFDDFNQAERFLFDKEPQKAVARYERTLRLTQEYWPEIIAGRLVIANDRAGQLDRSVQNWIGLLDGRWTGLAGAARLIPRNIPAKTDGRVARSVDLLSNEIRRNDDQDRRALLELVQFEILLRCGDARADELASRVAEGPIPAPARIESVYAILLEAVRRDSRDSSDAATLSAVDRAIRDAPEASLPGFLMLKGELHLRTARSRDELIHAGWCFLRVAIHFPDHPLAPRALLAGANVVQKLDRPDQAAALLTECLAKPEISAETRKEAQRFLAELGQGAAP